MPKALVPDNLKSGVTKPSRYEPGINRTYQDLADHYGCVVDDRHGCGSTIVTSQLPVEHWHEAIANPTVADAIRDRLVYKAHRLTLKGDSLRKVAAKRSGLDEKPTT